MGAGRGPSARRGAGRRAWSVAVASHLVAGAAILVSLRLFLTPPSELASVPPQTARYVVYGLTAFAGAIAAGSMLAVLVTGRSWLPAVYLWLLPLVLVALPQIDPGVAGFIYAGFTGHLGAGLAISAAALWIAGCLIGFAVAYGLDLTRSSVEGRRWRPRSSSE